jgi:serine/threonine protein kinase/uncharacterized protein YjbI with pentapeptide repeats
MSDDTDLLDLLNQWQQAYQQGRDLPPSQLCAGRPHLEQRLAEQIARLKAMGWLVRPPAEEHVATTPPPAPHGGSARSAWPSLSGDELGALLTQSGLLPAEELKAVQSQLASSGRTADAQALAEELVRQQKLTAYQARALMHRLLPTLIFGEYVIVDELGAGGVGRVFKAVHRRLQKLFALKILHERAVHSPAAVRRFHQEVKAAARLEHPNVVRTVYAGEQDGVHYLVMEYVEGKDLHHLVKQQGPLAPERALDFIIQAARGLEYAHSQGVIHRDIKPGNLLVDARGMVKILDLGLARIAEPAGEEATALTRTGMVLGTAHFMSPEQAANTKAADARSDLYSLGCTLYYLLTGRTPYQGSSPVEVILAHRDEPIPSLVAQVRGLPAAVDDVFRRLVAKKPEDRYASATELLADLEPLRRLLAVQGRPRLGGEEAASRQGACAPSASTESRAGGTLMLESLGEAADVLAHTPAGEPQQRTLVERPEAPRRVRPVAADAAAAPPSASAQRIPPRTATLTGQRTQARPARPVQRPHWLAWLALAVAALLAAYASWPPRIPAAAAPPGRGPASERVAAWVLACGGKVDVRTKRGSRTISRSSELPSGPYSVEAVWLQASPVLQRCRLPSLAGLENNDVRVLSLSGTRLAGGLAPLAVFSKLEVIDLTDTPTSDADLATLARLANLRELYLNRTLITDVGMERLAECSTLEVLAAADTQITGRGLAALAKLPRLQRLSLSLDFTADTLRGAQLPPALAHLQLVGARVTEGGMEHLQSATQLVSLDLSGCNLRQADLTRLASLSALEYLDLSAAQVSPGQIARLRETRPQLRVVGAAVPGAGAAEPGALPPGDQP